MLILVTGAAGNLGRSVAARLLADGHRVRAFDLESRRNRRVLRALGPGAEPHLGDVTCPGDVERAMRDVDAVAHLAAVLPPSSERRPAVTRRVNVEGTRELVQAAERLGKAIPFVLTSSCSLYGPGQAARGVAGSDSPIVATDAYTSSKIEAEAIVRGSSLEWVILRLGAAIEASTAATDPIVLRLMFEIDPDHPIEVVHGEDVATAVARAIVEPRAHRRILPIGGGASCRMRQRELLAFPLGLLGVGELPLQAFGASPYYTCWLDTEESERLLRYQQRDLAAIRRDMARRLGPLGVLGRFAGPLVRRLVLRYSGPWHGAPPRGTLRALIDAGY